ncbi:MAG: hypothetical protein K1X67_24140 [Fimbriimonadaceae bacterium]|nr:hypothetical protein [Fimbriimonadaceae bacterium]
MRASPSARWLYSPALLPALAQSLLEVYMDLYNAWIRFHLTSPGSSRNTVVIPGAKLPKEFVELVLAEGRGEVTFSAVGTIRLKRCRRAKP